MKIFSLILIGLLVLLQAGCATYKNSLSMPAVDGVISFEVSDKKSSSWSNDVIVGTYSVPDSQVVISGHQTGGGGGGFLFGFLGVLLEHSIDKANGKKTVSAMSDQLSFYINKNVEEKIQSNIQNKGISGSYVMNDSSQKYMLSVKPMLVLTYTWDNNKVRPFTILNVALHERGKEEKVWGSRYISSIGESRALAGENSWLENDNLLLNNFIVENLDVSVDFMMKDFQSPYDRETKNRIVVEGHAPFLKSVFRIAGQKLVENDRFIAYVPQSADAAVISGVIIADKKYVISRAATSKDKPYKKIYSEEEKKFNAEALDRRF